MKKFLCLKRVHGSRFRPEDDQPLVDTVRRLIFILLFVVLALLTMNYQLRTISADEISDLQKQIDELNLARQQSVDATKPLEGQLGSLKIQLAQIQVKLQTLSANIIQKEKEVKVREDKLVAQQVLLSERVRSYYIRSYFASPLLVVLSSGGSGNLLRELS
ncbi:MAG: hypothetical protein UV41_C0045G0014, partial [Candidatus Daviesbacteria bacterium GW2011_GWA2_42_7]